ncbi:MAG: glycosyltransferase family 39 protein [Chloroflexota bacterium]
MDSQSLRGDEAASATYASLSFAEILDITRIADPHPPLFYLVLGVWESFVGTSEYAVRFWVVIPAVLTVALLYQFARQLTSQTAGVLSACLLALNSFHIWHAQDVRSYTWFILLGLVSTFVLQQATLKRRWIMWTLYGVSLLILFYVHYYSAFLLVFHGLYVAVLFLQEVRNGKMKSRGQLIALPIQWGSMVVVALLLFLPWLSQSWEFVTRFTGDFDPAMPQVVLARGLFAFSGGVVDLGYGQARWVFIYVVLASFGVWTAWRTKVRLALLLSLYFTLPFVGIMILTLRGQAFTERYLLSAIPAFMMLVALGIDGVSKMLNVSEKWLIAPVLLATVWFNGQALQHYHFTPEFAKSPEWKEAFDYVAQHRQPDNDALLYNFPEASVTYYLDTYLSPQREGHNLPVILAPPTANPAFADLDQYLTTLLADYKGVWLTPINARGWDDDRQLERWLHRYGDRQLVGDFRWIRAERYLTPKAIAQTMTHQKAEFVNGITLRGFQLFNTMSIDGGYIVHETVPLDLSLYWTTTQTTEHPLTVFVQLIDETGFFRGGQDNQPIWGTYPTTDWVLERQITDKFIVFPQPDAPSGMYQVWIGFYDGTTGERVLILDQVGNPGADHVVLETKVIIE